MGSIKFSPNRRYTRLDARITENEGAFTVSVRLLNHRKKGQGASGEEIASSINIATAMINSIAEQFGIGQKGISVKIIMENFKEGTFH